MLTASRYVYFLTHTLLAPMFFFYISFVVGRSINWNIRYVRHHSNVWDILVMTALVVMELLVIFNPFFTLDMVF